MKEMIKHLVNLLFVNALFIFVVRKRTKSGAEYNIKLIGQPTKFKLSAAVIGISFAVIAILIVIVFTHNVMIVIALMHSR